MSFQDELLDELKSSIGAGSFIVEESSDQYFSQLAAVFPTAGSKIAWSRVEGSIVATTRNIDDLTQWLEFFFRTVEEKSLDGMVVYVNDSAFECALRMPIGSLTACIDRILEYPEHHYFIGEDFRWCMTFAMEGDMAFGLRPGTS